MNEKEHDVGSIPSAEPTAGGSDRMIRIAGIKRLLLRRERTASERSSAS